MSVYSMYICNLTVCMWMFMSVHVYPTTVTIIVTQHEMDL